MSWGLPPKYKIEHHIRNISIDIIHQSTVNAMINMEFNVEENSEHFVGGFKKLPLTFLSFFVFSKPKISIVILITNAGKVTIKSEYDYDSMFGIAFNDHGKQKRELSSLLTEIVDITKLNNSMRA
jgi:hypothetical protein